MTIPKRFAGALLLTALLWFASARGTGAVTARRNRGIALRDAPVNTVPATQSVNEDSPLVFAPGTSNAISVADADAAPGLVQVTLSAANGTLSLGSTAGLSFSTGTGAGDATVTFAGSVTDINAALNGLTFTPTANFNGSALLILSATDPGGSGGAQTATATVGITVVPVNDPPVAQNESVSINEDTPATIALAATDIDSPALTYSIVTPPVNGTLSGTPPNLLYTPAANYNGPDSFTYKANDEALDSNIATVSITVTPVADAPNANPDTATTHDGVAVDIDVVANDTDVDGHSLKVNGVSDVTHGTASINADGTVLYSPTPGYTGTATFSYTISDGAGGIATAVVTVTIVPGPSLRVTVTPASVREDAGLGAATGTVTLPASAKGPATVALSSSAPARLLPAAATVLIPAGSSSATFRLDAIDNSVAEGAQSVVLTASAPGFTAANATVTVADNDVKTLALAVKLGTIVADHLTEGAVATGTVSRNTSPVGSLVVTLTSSNPAKLNVPHSVTIPNGAAAAPFRITVGNNVVADGPTLVTLSATATGFVAGTSSLVVVDNEPASKFTVSGHVTTSVVAATGAVTAAPLPAAHVRLLVGSTVRDIVTTDSTGQYRFTDLPAGPYTVSPLQPGVTFAPTAHPVALTTASASGLDFVATERGQISGHVSRLPADAARVALSGVTVTLRSVSGVITTRTDATGRFVFSNLPLAAYTVTPTLSHTYFQPRIRTVALTPALPASIPSDFVVAGTDAVPPAISVTLPHPGSFTIATQPKTVTGTASDSGGAGLASVTGALLRYASATAVAPNGFYKWTANGFGTADNALVDEKPAAGTAMWTLTGLPILPAGFYGIRATATDAAGNTTRATIVRFTITPPPPPAGDTAASAATLSTVTASAATSSVTLRFAAALDAESAADATNYTVRVNDQSVMVESAGYDAVSHSVTLALPPDTLHHGDYVAVAWNGLINAQGVSGNTGPVTAR